MTTSVQPNPQPQPQPPALRTSNVWQPALESAAREIFNVMLDMRIDRVAIEPPLVADLTVMVGINGAMRGVIGLHTNAATACRLASMLLGAQTDEFDERVLDAVGEIANMIAGSFKSKAPGLGEKCALSVPTVIAGSDYHLHLASNGDHVEMTVSFEGSPLWLTLDIRK
jgi:chemotaxis protein CheX